MFLLEQTEIMEFKKLIQPFLYQKEIQKMKLFVQHGKVSCYDHCISVAYVSYWICKKLNLRVQWAEMVRGAMLHDFFLYDWHIKNEPRKLHGFYHPSIALKNAKKLFDLTEIEDDIIIKHMWPLTFIPPKYKEAYVICVADKVCSILETLHISIPLPFLEKNSNGGR